MSKIDDVAKLAKVSTATVSRVLNKSATVSGDTQRRVLKAVKQLGYRPNKFAKALAGNSSDSIGVIVPDLAESFFGTLIKGVEAMALKHDLQVAVASGNRKREDEQRAFEWLKRHGCDAQIIFTWSIQAQESQPTLTDAATVIIGQYIPEFSGRCIYLDDEQGGRLATSHLIEHGHSSIAHVLYPISIAASFRSIGYRQALDRANLTYDPDLVVVSDGFDEESGYRAAERLLSRGKKFSAIFAASDQLATGVIAALRNQGLGVPQDISVVGYNNSAFAQYTYPPLTTIHQPIFEMAQSACLLAIGLMKGESAREVNQKFEPTLVERSSVARPRTP